MKQPDSNSREVSFQLFLLKEGFDVSFQFLSPIEPHTGDWLPLLPSETHSCPGPRSKFLPGLISWGSNKQITRLDNVVVPIEIRHLGFDVFGLAERSFLGFVGRVRDPGIWHLHRCDPVMGDLARRVRTRYGQLNAGPASSLLECPNWHADKS